MQAAEFLRDETTVSEVTDNLVAMLRKAMEGPVTEEMQARVHTVRPQPLSNLCSAAMAFHLLRKQSHVRLWSTQARR